MYIRLDSNPSYTAQNFLLEGILSQARALGFPEHTYFCFLLYDDDQKVQGGIKGSNFYGSLYIDYIYVAPDLRGQGYGRALLKAAEDWGTSQDCSFATLTTMSFEAKDFYQHIGYQIEFEQQGYLNGASMFYLRKDLI